MKYRIILACHYDVERYQHIHPETEAEFVYWLKYCRDSVFRRGGDIRINRYDKGSEPLIQILLEIKDYREFERFKQAIETFDKSQVEPLLTENPEFILIDRLVNVEDLKPELKMNLGAQVFGEMVYGLLMKRYKEIVPDPNIFEFIIPFLNQSCLILEDEPWGVIRYGVFYLNDTKPTVENAIKHLSELDYILTDKA